MQTHKGENGHQTLPGEGINTFNRDRGKYIPPIGDKLSLHRARSERLVWLTPNMGNKNLLLKLKPDKRVGEEILESIEAKFLLLKD